MYAGMLIERGQGDFKGKLIHLVCTEDEKA